MDALPIFPGVRIRLKALIPKPYAENPQTVGEHIKRQRMLRRLTQKQTAVVLGVSQYTIIDWEKGRSDAPVRCGPAILAFLGYDPFSKPETLGHRMLSLRRRMGWSIREAAHRLGVDPGTWGAWERTGRVLWPRYQVLLDSFLALRRYSGTGIM